MDDDRALDIQPAENDEPPAKAVPSGPAPRAALPAYPLEYSSFDAGSCLSNMLKLLGVVLLVGMIAVCLLAVLALAGINTGVGAVTGWLNSVFNAPTPAPAVLNTQTVLTLVQREAVLETVRYNFEKVVPVEFVQHLGGVSGEKLLFVGVGYVGAGVDFARLGEDAITLDGDAVTVALPPAQLTTCVLDPQRSYVYEHDVGFLNFVYEAFYDEPDLLEVAERESIAAFRESALEGGILDQAWADAEIHLRAILMAAGAKSVTIQRAEGVTPQHDPACVPPQPETP